MPKILVVDDQPTLRKNLARMLELEGFEVATCDTGRLAIEKVRDTKPDLILCDVMMSGMDGYAVLQALRAEAETAAIPFIFLTGRGTKFDQRAGMNAGADDYLTKPVDREDLLAAIHARLQRKASLDRQAASTLTNARMSPDFSSAGPLEKLGLTAREAQVLLWVAQGKSNSDVGIVLGMAEKTVKTHLGNVFNKLGVESRTAAAIRALEVLAAPAPATARATTS